MNNEKIAIVIVTYNGEKHIENCLRDIGKYYLVIVVDNNSSDNTICLIKSKFPWVRLIQNNLNYGFGKANNQGISLAIALKVDFVLLLNQDTSITSSSLKRLIQVAKNNSEYSILSPLHYNSDGSAIDRSFLEICPKQLFSDLIIGKVKKDIYQVPFINAAAWLMPIDTIRKIGGFDPIFFMYAEDVNYVQRMNFFNLKMGIIPNCYIFHNSENNFYKDKKFSSEVINHRVNQYLLRQLNPSHNGSKILYKITFLITLLMMILKNLLTLNKRSVNINIKIFYLVIITRISAKIKMYKQENFIFLNQSQIE